MKFKQLVAYWKSDYQRYRNYNVRPVSILLFTPGFRYTFYMRLCNYLKNSRFRKAYIPLFIICRLILRRYEFKYSIQLPYNTQVGYGLHIGHHGGIVINQRCKIGNNVNLSHGVTLGYTRTGVPRVGNDVYLGAGAKVIGGITIGNNVAIGANSVVTKNMPDNAIVVGIPGKIISLKGNRPVDAVSN
jgi:serine O-acetyltransferase